MGMAAILLNGTEPFEQIVNILLTVAPFWTFNQHSFSYFSSTRQHVATS